MWDIMTRPIFLIAVSAIGYAAATFAMKSASATPGFVAIAAIAVCLSAAVLAEVTLLRTTHLGLVYLAILAAETILVMSIAAAIGEGLAPRDIAGGLLVLFGAGILST